MGSAALNAGDNVAASGLLTDQRGATAGEEAAWLQNLQSGLTRGQMVQAFLGSDELYGLAVDAFYSAYLHRQGENAGESGWLQLPRGGRTFETIAVGILTSGEFAGNAQG